MRRAFVSHSTHDDSYVAELDSLLRAAGFDDVFNDVSSIKPDEQFWQEIEKGITECDSLFVVITAASNDSDWVKREVECARSLGKKVIPLWVEDCSVPAIFAARDVIDLRRRTRELPHTEISHIFKYAPSELIGRETEKKLISDAWGKVLCAEAGRPSVLTFVAFGGEGKTSLVAKWVVDEMCAKGWPGCDAAFAWSFYSQGTCEQVAASSDLFLKNALAFFGDDADKQFAASPAGAYEKGQRLARVVGQRRSLLILDGLEPLQYTPSSPTPGQFKDQGIAALLKGLATASHGLCVVTSRYPLPDLRVFWQTTAPEIKLLRLSRAAGVHLLQSFGVKGSQLRNLSLDREQVNEFEKLVEDVQGHALTLNLLGTYLRDAHAGDISKRDLVKLEEADAEEQGGHAFRVMEAYEREFEREGDKGHRALAVLRLLGLFDRPVASHCLGALLQTPALPGLTEPLFTVETKWRRLKHELHPIAAGQLNLACKRLEDAGLLTVNRDAVGALETLDAHPLLREYFARQLRTHQPDACRAAHRRLYEHLCAITKEGDQPTLEDLQPLYQAVAHGCQAGWQRNACEEVYYLRILRRGDHYSWQTLGAVSSDLGAVHCFFEHEWNSLVPGLAPTFQGLVMNQAALYLRAVGRLTEALEPMQAAIELSVVEEHWVNASKSAANLSELELVLGNISVAISAADQSIIYADRCGDDHEKLVGLATSAGALHQLGHTDESLKRFRTAEKQNAELKRGPPLLFTLVGFQYCDLLLSTSELYAWHAWQNLDRIKWNWELLKNLHSVGQRASTTVKLHERNVLLRYIALDHLTLARAALYKVIVKHSAGLRSSAMSKKQTGNNKPAFSALITTQCQLETAVDGLRRANQLHLLPHGLLTRAWLRFLSGARIGTESAHADLDEAWEIAEHGRMRLHMADIHLYRARLFFRESEYPWESPQADLAAAEKLIDDCGYHRRDEELADAKAAILSK
ncbi:MAG: toll/interleukin-1 receptor domain-containing protein [Verrucomicrobiota bacterium]